MRFSLGGSLLDEVVDLLPELLDVPERPHPPGSPAVVAVPNL